MNTNNSISIEKEKCVGCGLCTLDCPRKIISLENEKAAVKDVACLECYHCVAICPHGAISSSKSPNSAEYEGSCFDIAPKTLLNRMQFRRTARKYKKDKIKEEDLQMLMEAARSIPTGGNRQQLRYIMLDEKMDEVRRLCMKELKELVEREPNHRLIPDDNYRKTYLTMLHNYEEKGIDRLFFNAPHVVVIISKKAGIAQINGGIAGGYMDLMASTLGLGMCFLGYFTVAAQISPALNKMLGVQEDEVIITAFTLGYPEYEYHRSVERRPLDFRKY